MARIRRSKTNTTYFMDIPKDTLTMKRHKPYEKKEEDDWFEHKEEKLGVVTHG